MSNLLNGRNVSKHKFGLLKDRRKLSGEGNDGVFTKEQNFKRVLTDDKPNISQLLIPNFEIIENIV